MLIPLDEATSYEIEKVIRQIEVELVNKNFDQVVSLATESKLSARDIEDSLSEYGGRVTIAPDYVFHSLEIIPLSGSDPKSWVVDFDLWIDGKRSDLTLSMEVSVTREGATYSINNLHVM